VDTFVVSRDLWVYGDPMLRPSPPPSVVALPLALSLALLGTLSGCGSDEDESREGGKPTKAAQACRADWKDLADEVDDRSSATNPSALAPRWNTVAATADYYAAFAGGSDCGSTIEGQEKAMDDLAAFAAKLAPYDMEQRLDEVQSDAEQYAASPRPPAPSPSAVPGKKKGQKQKRAPRPPKPADIATALKTLTTQAPLATQQQGPGWEQARVIEISDAAAVAKTVKDLAFLSSESPAYRACTVALAQIRLALTVTP
jgi:hypothetical protein